MLCVLVLWVVGRKIVLVYFWLVALYLVLPPSWEWDCSANLASVKKSVWISMKSGPDMRRWARK
jgi:hypothetical protein